MSDEYTYSGKEDRYAAEKLMEGHICKLTGYGNSMTPKLKSGQSVICIPVTEDVPLKKKDIVFCKVNGHYYLHMISAIKGKSYQISNNHYLHDVEVCQRFARRNREKMAGILLEKTGIAGGEAFHTIHNYIDTEEMILRKGAIAAHTGEKVLIPINMRDGSVLAVGKGNAEWNYSAPHGAGRIMSRNAAKERLSLEEYRETMKGIYTTSVNESTLDEAPMAYKSLEDIIDVIRDSVDIIDVMKPIYNFKTSD